MRYAPIEGECLSAAWALEKTNCFTLGGPALYLAVDHKQLLKVLGDKHLEGIDNPCLFSLKENTLRYRFKCIHVPGNEHNGTDFTSRYPTTLEEVSANLDSMSAQDE